MLSTDEQRKICKEYSKRDETGKVQCHLCPLCISVYWCMCHANSHFDPDECEFVPDDCGKKKHTFPVNKNGKKGFTNENYLS